MANISNNNRKAITLLVGSALLASYFIYNNKDSIKQKIHKTFSCCEKKKHSKKRITVLISGSGSNLQAIIDKIKDNTIPDAEIVSVISSSKKAYGLTRAAENNIPTTVHSLFPYYKGVPKEDSAKRAEKRVEFELKLAEIINETKPDIVVCAGWLLILGKDCLSNLKNKVPIINLHPALPGAFDGTVHAIDMAYEHAQELKKMTGENFTAGCMCHYVIEDVDKGEPIVVKELVINPDEETLSEYETRLHKTEHIAIVEATNKVLGNI
ncbi:Phosphoribosylglycinamide formyltransferase [Hanseniaspora valbyensis]